MREAGADCNTSRESIVCADQIVIRVPYGYEAHSLNDRSIGSDTIDVFPIQPGRWWLPTKFQGALMNAGRRLAGICLLTTLAVSATAQNALLAQTPVVGIELSSRAATVLGTVVDGDDKPVPAARLRLRDLTSGRLLMTTRGDQVGEFRFGGVPAGSYLVEFVDPDGNVRGVSQTFVLAPAETRATIVRLAGRKAWYAGFFNNAAMAVVSSAASLGVTAVGSGVQPASGRF